MYLSKLRIWNFRRYSMIGDTFDTAKPGIEVEFNDAAPIYTRPAEYKGWRVPDILLSGHEAKIKEWEMDQAMERTKRLRPDLLK